MAEQNDKDRKFVFIDQYVSVIFDETQKDIFVERKPKGSLEDMPGVSGKFEPNNLIINFRLFKKENNSITYPTTFSPPFEMRVGYTKADQDHAKKKAKDMQLAFWSGSEWVPFTEEKHKFKLKGGKKDKWEGEGVLEISEWSDPPIAWGP